MIVYHSIGTSCLIVWTLPWAHLRAQRPRACAWFVDLDVDLDVDSLKSSVCPCLFSGLLDSNVKLTKQSSECCIYTWMPPHLCDLLALCTIPGFVVNVCIAMLSRAAYFSKCAQFNPHKDPLNYSSISTHCRITLHSFVKCGRLNEGSLVCIVDCKLYNSLVGFHSLVTQSLLKDCGYCSSFLEFYQWAMVVKNFEYISSAFISSKIT